MAMDDNYKANSNFRNFSNVIISCSCYCNCHNWLCLTVGCTQSELSHDHPQIFCAITSMEQLLQKLCTTCRIYQSLIEANKLQTNVSTQHRSCFKIITISLITVTILNTVTTLYCYTITEQHSFSSLIESTICTRTDK